MYLLQTIECILRYLIKSGELLVITSGVKLLQVNLSLPKELANNHTFMHRFGSLFIDNIKIPALLIMPRSRVCEAVKPLMI